MACVSGTSAAWRRAGSEPVEEFIARARPLIRTEPCLVAGCDRERVTRRGLCRFHDNRLQRQRNLASMSQEELAAWVADERPRLAAHQFSLAGLPELAAHRAALRAATPRSGSTSAGPTEVRILLGRLDGAGSVRDADLETVCESGGVQYNSAIKGCSATCAGIWNGPGPSTAAPTRYAGDVWQVALLDLHVNGSRRWPATEGIVDFGAIELRWLREVVKDWARATRPYLQRLRETLRACRVASDTLVAAGRADPASLGAGDFARRRAGHRRATAQPTAPLLRLAPQPAALPVLPGDRARPRQRADDRRCPTRSARRSAVTGSAATPTRTSWARRCPTP